MFVPDFNVNFCVHYEGIGNNEKIGFWSGFIIFNSLYKIKYLNNEIMRTIIS